MGRVTPVHCDHWRGLMAMEVVGRLEPGERLALEAHVEGCAECRAERIELLRLSPALAAAEPSHVESSDLPPRLHDAVVTRLRADARRDRSRRKVRVLNMAAAAAAVVVGVVLAAVQPWQGAPGRTLALHGAGNVTASVTLVPEAWGTKLQLQETGQPGGQVLTVAMRGSQGRWWAAGTYRTVSGRTVTVDLACAAPAGAVYAVYVRDGAGQTVLRSEA